MATKKTKTAKKDVRVQEDFTLTCPSGTHVVHTAAEAWRLSMSLPRPVNVRVS